MALVWIVTTGNSDVAMASAKDWKDLKTKKNLPLIYNKLPISELSNNKKQEKLFFLPARALGNLYGDVLDDEKYSKTLRFALLQGFVDKLKDKNKKPDRIIILLTDQAAIFGVSDRNSIDSPYWKDTCTLKPILEHYLRQEFNSAKIEFAILQPKAGENGLDDWDSTLKLVQKEFAELQITSNDTVIVSHQAGTPAISSAVQFVSLSSFRGEVSFLLSNECSQEVNLIEYSSYFQSMEIKEAIKLLENHDYAGVSFVLEERLKRLKADGSDDANKISALLEVAKLWNLSKFDDDFKNMIKSLPIDDLREMARIRFGDSWAWWIAYEEAYLAIVRRRQGNIVEAFFHSFRAFEGIFAVWGGGKFTGHIDDSKKVPSLKPSVLDAFAEHFSNSKSSDVKSLREKIEKIVEVIKQNETTSKKEQKKVEKVELNFATLCKLFKLIRTDYDSLEAEKIGIKLLIDTQGISTERNSIFHQVKGISEDNLLKSWDVNSIYEWEDKILRFLNFIADEKDFKTWKEASLMARVHQELEEMIDAIAK